MYFIEHYSGRASAFNCFSGGALCRSPFCMAGLPPKHVAGGDFQLGTFLGELWEHSGCWRPRWWWKGGETSPSAAVERPWGGHARSPICAFGNRVLGVRHCAELRDEQGEVLPHTGHRAGDRKFSEAEPWCSLCVERGREEPGSCC